MIADLLRKPHPMVIYVLIARKVREYFIILVEWVFFLPGDALLLVLMEVLPGIGTFFELTPASFGGWFSGIASLLSWANVPLFVVGVWRTIKEDEPGFPIYITIFVTF